MRTENPKLCQECGAVDQEDLDRCETCGKRLCDSCMGQGTCEVERKRSGFTGHERETTHDD